MTTGITIRAKARFRSGRKGTKRPAAGEVSTPEVPQGRIPRVTRLLALAHRFEVLIRDGDVRDYADLARLGHVTRARVTQIMNLLNLAPDIQEAILLLPAERGRDSITERDLRPIAALANWRRQRNAWKTHIVRSANDST